MLLFSTVLCTNLIYMCNFYSASPYAEFFFLIFHSCINYFILDHHIFFTFFKIRSTFLIIQYIRNGCEWVRNFWYTICIRFGMDGWRPWIRLMDFDLYSVIFYWNLENFFFAECRVIVDLEGRREDRGWK